MKMLKRQRHWRSDKRDPALEVPSGRGGSDDSHVPRGVSAVPFGHTPSEDAIRIEELEQFQRAFSSLTERHQELIRLHHGEGWTHAEIAAELGITAANSRMQLSRALARLAEVTRELNR